MSLDQFPFMAVTVTCLFAHLVFAVVAIMLEPTWKGDTFISRWWGPASFVRLFSIRRSDLKWSVTWGFLLMSRIAFAVFAVSLLLDIIIN
jgi:hypothetical protein